MFERRIDRSSRQPLGPVSVHFMCGGRGLGGGLRLGGGGGGGARGNLYGGMSGGSRVDDDDEEEEEHAFAPTSLQTSLEAEAGAELANVGALGYEARGRGLECPVCGDDQLQAMREKADASRAATMPGRFEAALRRARGVDGLAVMADELGCGVMDELVLRENLEGWERS